MPTYPCSRPALLLSHAHACISNRIELIARPDLRHACFPMGQATRCMRPPGGGKAPERVPQAIACRLHRLLSPRFDDPCVEASYLQFAARGSEAVQRFFALTISVSQAMLLASQAAWAAWSGQEFSAGFELCKLLLLLAMLYLGVRRSDEASRREFATRAPQRYGHAAAPQAARSAAPASARAAAALRDREASDPEVVALGPPLARPLALGPCASAPRLLGQRSLGVHGVITRGMITRGLMRGKTDVARELMLWPGAKDYYRVGAGHRYLAVHGGVLSTSSPPVHKSNSRGASHGLHAIDATPARWRGGVVSYRSIQPARTSSRREMTYRLTD